MLYGYKKQIFELAQLSDPENCKNCGYLRETIDAFGTGDSFVDYSCDCTDMDNCKHVETYVEQVTCPSDELISDAFAEMDAESFGLVNLAINQNNPAQLMVATKDLIAKYAADSFILGG